MLRMLPFGSSLDSMSHVGVLLAVCCRQLMVHPFAPLLLLLQVFDRPFLFFLVETTTQTVIFQGAIADPRGIET